MKTATLSQKQQIFPTRIIKSESEVLEILYNDDSGDELIYSDSDNYCDLIERVSYEIFRCYAEYSSNPASPYYRSPAHLFVPGEKEKIVTFVPVIVLFLLWTKYLT